MSLLTVVSLAVLSLSSISVRSSSHDQAKIKAQANARMSLILAIEQLQVLAGQDTRVTASSHLLDENAIRVTGVWRSWEGSNRQSDGKPIAPNYSAKRNAGDPSIAVTDAPGDGRFLGWLTSANLPDDPDDTFPSSQISNQTGDNLVAMVSTGSVAESSEEVYILPTSLEKNGNQSGSFAWWISGDNAKAMVNTKRGGEPTTVQDWQQRVRSGGRADGKSFNLQEVDDLGNDKIVPSTSTLQILADAGTEIRKFHDMTAFSRGLLTNTATGGWRRDLSLFTESYDGDTSDGDPTSHSTTKPLPGPSATAALPVYTLKSGEVSLARKAFPVNSQVKDPGAMLYPWASYRNHTKAWGYTGPIGSWTSLVDYANQYKVLTQYSAAKTQFPSLDASHSWATVNHNTLWSDKIRVAPIISRVHWIFSMAAEPVQLGTSAETKYNPKLLLTPAVTIWNPYNVEMTIPASLDYRMDWHGQTMMPFRFKFSIDGKPLYQVINNEEGKYLEGAPFNEISESNGRIHLNFPNTEDVILAPGAAKIFSVDSATPKVGNDELDLAPGYHIGGGFLFDLKDLSGSGLFTTDTQGRILIDGDARFEVHGVNFSPTLTNDQSVGQEDVGIYATVFAGGDFVFPLRNVFNVEALASSGKTGPEVLAEIYPPLEEESGWAPYADQIQAFSIADGTTRPFASAILASRPSSPIAAPDEPDFAHLASKGMLQANPLCFYQTMRIAANAMPGVKNFINSNYTFSYRYVNGWNDSGFGWIPQVGADGVGSYIVTGMSPANGLNRCIMAELPTRPIQSLIDLQHWDARNNNPVPPYQFNLIGNGSATPILPPDGVSREVSGQLNQYMCNDDSYLLNHVLFDDWFVSSIAPDYGDFGSTEERSISEVYEDHLTGAEPLPNRSYLYSTDSIVSDIDEEVSNVISGEKDSETGKYSYETIASKLEVEGMFNINSTSIEAWQALLRQSRDLEVPYMNADGSIETDTARSFSYPRSSIAGGQGSDSGLGNASEFAGHRVLTEDQVSALAKNIVDEIRERGPFLSLSEFINRRLSTDKDLAIAGAVQKALDNLADMGDVPENPFSYLQQNSVAITEAPPGNHDYEFPEAALGHSAFGLPGWIRQADILRPMASILSVRDDTFTIRAYGDARDPSDPEKVIAKAWCEAVVVRSAEFIDASDNTAVTPHSSEMQSPINKQFGRKFKIVSFRWLKENEI